MALSVVKEYLGSAANGVAAANITITAPAAGNALIVFGNYGVGKSSSNIVSVSGGGVTWSLDISKNLVNGNCELWSGLNSSGSGTTVTVTFGGTYSTKYAWVLEVSGMVTSGTRTDGTGSNQLTNPGSSSFPSASAAFTPSAGVDVLILAGFTVDSTKISSGPAGFTTAVSGTPGTDGQLYYKVVTSPSGSYNPTMTTNSNYFNGDAVVVAYKAASTAGIAFDAAGNSGDQAAASSYSGPASWSGSDRMLAIDVSMLGAGVTVTAMTYGGAACTFIGSRSTVTSLGSVEQWRICSSDPGAPAAGSNTLSVTLSSSIEFAVEWVSYTGVQQTSPTEGFNSNQATNTGSATDASVSITSVADNCWIHAAVVANDTSIVAGQTSRNNISGTLGSGGNEDNNAAVTPPGSTTMSYSGMGVTTTWAIAGYAIRPLAAANLTTSNPTSNMLLLGVG